MQPLPVRLLAAFAFALAACSSAALAAVAFDTATVTRVQNEVVVGAKGAPSGENARPARVSDTVLANHYILTSSQSRAELQFKDESFVRVGQNTIFTFDGGSRTLSLKKGAVLFYVKPGSGGGTIETPALTAAITGTVGLAYECESSYLAVIHGALQTKFGPVHPGQKIDAEGKVTKFDIEEVKKGKLYAFGGIIPDFGEFTGSQIANLPGSDLPRTFDLLEITQLNPAVRAFLNTPAIRPEKQVEVRKPLVTTPASDPPPPHAPYIY